MLIKSALEDELKFVVENIKKIRTQKCVSQMELSLRSNLSLSFIANLETGKKQPSVLTLLKIAKALEVSPKIFFPEGSVKSKEDIKTEITALLAEL